MLDAPEARRTAVPKHDYAFADRNSVERYWAEQATLWRGIAVEPAHYALSAEYPVSAERSTALWVADADPHDVPQRPNYCDATSPGTCLIIDPSSVRVADAPAVGYPHNERDGLGILLPVRIALRLRVFDI